uniref:Uncharacterized protein n=1 Tax=Panagrolaimus sp. ES5 TaxID=591445 RepID=A0AC34G004_9BILA
MKTNFIVVVFVAIFLHLSFADLNVLDGFQAQEIADEMNQLHRDINVMEKRLINMEPFENGNIHDDQSLPIKQESNELKHDGKRINKKSLGDIVNFLGSFLIG